MKGCREIVTAARLCLCFLFDYHLLIVSISDTDNRRGLLDEYGAAIVTAHRTSEDGTGTRRTVADGKAQGQGTDAARRKGEGLR